MYTKKVLHFVRTQSMPKKVLTSPFQGYAFASIIYFPMTCSGRTYSLYLAVIHQFFATMSSDELKKQVTIKEIYLS